MEKEIRAKRTLPQLMATVFINEVMPKQKRHGFFIPAELVAMVVQGEFDGRYDRRVTRWKIERLYALFIADGAKERCLEHSRRAAAELHAEFVREREQQT